MCVGRIKEIHEPLASSSFLLENQICSSGMVAWCLCTEHHHNISMSPLQMTRTTLKINELLIWKKNNGRILLLRCMTKSIKRPLDSTSTAFFQSTSSPLLVTPSPRGNLSKPHSLNVLVDLRPQANSRQCCRAYPAGCGSWDMEKHLQHPSTMFDIY